MVAIVTAVWGRPRVTELFLAQLPRLRDAWSPLEVRVYMAGNDGDNYELAMQHGVDWVMAPNDSIAHKFNDAAQQAWEDGAEYVIVLGSDDIIHPSATTSYRMAMGAEVMYAGLREVRFIQPHTQRAMKIPATGARGRLGEIWGAGRLVRRDVLALTQGRMWGESKIMRALDFRMTMRLRRDGIRPDAWLKGYAIDIKTGENIHPLEEFGKFTKRNIVTYDDTVAGLSAHEMALLRGLEGKVNGA